MRLLFSLIIGSILHWLLDLSLGKPRAASSSMQGSVGIELSGSCGLDGRALVIRMFASLWTLFSFARSRCLYRPLIHVIATSKVRIGLTGAVYIHFMV